MSALLEVRGVSVGYGRSRILNGVSLQVGAEEGVGLFGPNGHGKTTLLRTISGLLKPWGGDIIFAGEPIGGLPPREIVARGLIHVPQGNQLFPDMSVGETLRLGAFSPAARLSATRNLNLVHDIFPKLLERDGQLVRTLSGGERQMVAVGVGLMGNPRLLMLDEPTLGLAPKIKGEVCEAIGRVSQRGVPLLVVEQDVEFLLDLIDRLVMINHGEVAFEAAAGEGLDHDEIMAMYFGPGTAA